MRYLNKKLRRDLRRNWTQFFSVFLMAALSVLAFAGLEGAWRGMDNSVTTFVEESNLADSWIYATHFTDDNIEEIRAIEGVSDISAVSRLQTSVSINGSDTYLFVENFGNKDISIPAIIEGRDITSAHRGIWIDAEYAKYHNIDIGDYITVDAFDSETSLEVLGTIISPVRMGFTGTTDFVLPEPQLFGYGMVSDCVMLNYLAPHSLPNFLEIVHDNSRVRAAAPDILGESYIAYFDWDTSPEVYAVILAPGELQELSFLFSALFILLAILAMYTTIKRLVEVQTRDIATLKGLGYSNRAIGLHYSSYGLVVGLLGAFAGLAFAPPISNIVLDTQRNMYSLPSWGIFYYWKSIAILILLLVLICVIASFWASKSARRGLPAAYLRGDSAKVGKPTFIEGIRPLWSRVSYGARWTWRDGMSNPMRILMGIIGVAGGMMLLIAGFGLPDSLDEMIEVSYGTEFVHEMRVRINPLNSDAENTALRDEVQGQKIQSFLARVSPDDEAFGRIVTIFEEGDYINLQTVDGEPLGQAGAYITEGFANSAGLQVGDSVRLYLPMSTDSHTFDIVGMIASSLPQSLYINSSAWQDVGEDFQPTELLVGSSSRIDELRDDSRVTRVTLVEDQRRSITGMTENLGTIFNLITGFAILLVVVVLYNLGALSFTERMRDYATLRVLGFHRNEIRALVMRENIVTTLIGWIAGIPLGFWFMNQYLGAFSNHALVFYPHIELQSIALASLVVIGCSLTTTFLLSRRIRKIDMVEAIKGVE